MMKIVLWIVVLLGVAVAGATGAVVLGLRSFDRQVRAEIGSLLASAETEQVDVITEKDLDGLPAPVQRYLRYAGVVGKPRIRNAHVEQQGGFRTAPDQAWMPFTAQETYTTDSPGFIWQARISMGSLPILAVRDHYRAGEGRVLAKLGGLFAVADEEANEASLLRYFNELMWLPTAYLADNVVWYEVDDRHARATMSDHGMTVSALFTFGEDGEISNFEADRYCSVTEKIERWETPIDAWGEFEDVRVPLHGRGVWKLETGDFAYIDLKIVNVTYGVEGR